MHRSVAGRTPARRAAHVLRVVLIANEKTSTPLHLRVATEAKIWIRLHEHLLIDGAMRLMTRRAAFAQRFVFEHKAA